LLSQNDDIIFTCLTYMSQPSCTRTLLDVPN